MICSGTEDGHWTASNTSTAHWRRRAAKHKTYTRQEQHGEHQQQYKRDRPHQHRKTTERSGQGKTKHANLKELGNVTGPNETK